MATILNNDFDDDDQIDQEEDIEEILEPFDPTEIRVDTRPMTIDLLLKRIEYDELDLAPSFQRQADIWTDIKKSLLIESILIRIPIPAFYIDSTDEDKWLIIDGLQRLSTFKKFIIDKELILSGLEFLKNLNGKKYDELPRNYQRRINETVLTIYVIEKGTPPEVKFNIFKRINTGGLPLSTQELRHAINPGKATTFLSRLANSEQFKEYVNIGKNRKKRMDDHEFILGFIAFKLTNYENYPVNKGRDYFLNDAMKKINKISIEKELEIESNFIIALQSAFDIFGKDVFRKISNLHRKRQPINKALFEVWSVCLSQLTLEQIENLKQRKQILINRFIEQTNNDKLFLQSISQAANQVKYRFSTIEKIIEEVLS